MDERINLWLLENTFLSLSRLVWSSPLSYSHLSDAGNHQLTTHFESFNTYVHVISSSQTWQKGRLKLGVHSEVAERNFHAKHLGDSDNLDFIILLSKEEAERHKHFF